MNNDRQLVDMIEHANDAKPYCPCGMHTTPVWRDGTVWLECASIGQPPQGRLARLLAAVTAPGHVHEPIVDVAADEAVAA